MSKCISLKGEYTEHEPSGQEFVCGLCFAFDEDAAAAEVQSLRAQLAEREAVIAEVERLSNLDVKCPCCTGYSAILDTVTASPSTVLAEHDAQVLEEAAEMARGADAFGVESVPADWLRERAAEYRKGAGQ